MNVVAVIALVLASSGPDAGAPVVSGAAGDTPVFTREEPHLAAGRRALQSDDVDTAIERFRRAAASTDTERAVVEYDVGQALTMRALAEARAAHDAAAAGAGKPGAPGAEGTAPPPPPNVDDALAAFERAATLAREPRLVSEARLAAGNAALVGGKLDDAIAALRRALVADPSNERARRNLQRALTMKQQQPPPPPQDGDGDGDKQDGEQQKQDGDQQKQDGDQQKQDGDQQKQDGDQQKQDGDQQKQDGDQQKQDGEQQKQDGEQQKQDGEQQKQDGDQQKQDGDQQKAQPVKPKPTSKEEARRLLQGLRDRERPLSPLEMRGVEKRAPAPAGKDW